MAEASKWHRRIFEDFNVYFFKRHFIHMQKILPALQNYLSQKASPGKCSGRRLVKQSTLFPLVKY